MGDFSCHLTNNKEGSVFVNISNGPIVAHACPYETVTLSYSEDV